MTLKQYAAKINKLALKYPDAVVVYSSDDEGNSFSGIDINPSVGYFDENFNFSSNKREADSPSQRAVCVN